MQYSRQKPSVVHVCSPAQSAVLRQSTPATPVPAATQLVVLPLRSHLSPTPHSELVTGSHGMTSQLPPALQRRPVPQVPHEPEQPSVPHVRPVQLGVQMPQVFGTPAPAQVSGNVQLPHDTLRPTPQRSVTEMPPHVAPRAVQSSASVSATQSHWFGVRAPQVERPVQVPHDVMVRAVPQRSVVVSGPHSAPAAVQSCASVSGAHAHVPLVVHVVPGPQLPQLPPQPFGPHVRPVHSGVHAMQTMFPSTSDWQVVPDGHEGTPETVQMIKLHHAEPDEPAQ